MNTRSLLLLSILILLLTACSAAPDLQVSYDPSTLRFDGEQAYQIEKEFVTQFPNRVSGSEKTRQAASWLEQQLSSYGLDCQTDEWSDVLYSQQTPLYNVVCRLPGASPKEIVMVAHHDIASTTIEGAENDGAGIAILLELAKVFVAEGQPPYTLVFLASDAEEYGMHGTDRFIKTHPDPKNIIAAFTIDNMGKYYYDGMSTELIGQYRRFTPLWLALLVRESAAGGNNLWPVYLPGIIDQITGQAAPVSFMDQGPLVAAGVPALGFTGHTPPEFAAEQYAAWHDPKDNLKIQTPKSLGQSGLVAEAQVRQLLSMQTFPQESGPYLYFDDSQQVLRGWPLYLIFIVFVALFFLGSYLAGGRDLRKKWGMWKAAFPHFLGLWLPLLASIVLLYIFVAIGLMEDFDKYPATTKDPYLLNPRWPAIILYLLGLILFLILGRWIVRRFVGDRPAPSFGAIKSLALLVNGLGGIYVLILNPFTLLFCVPLLFWFLIGGRKRFGKVLDVVFFLLGGLMIYALIYIQGFLKLHYDLAFLWFVMNMFSICMFSFVSSIVITAIIAAGLTMIVNPPHKAQLKESTTITREPELHPVSPEGT
jgi:Peptidase family M28